MAHWVPHITSLWQHMRTRLILIAGVGVIVMGSIGTLMYHNLHTQARCPFPSAILKTADVHLYCPNETTLPSAVTSNVRHATTNNQTVIYDIHDGSVTLAVSLQEKPSDAQLANFVQNLIPLHIDTQTTIGTAQTGVSNNRSLTSLPTPTDTWIIVTAPASYDTNRLVMILKAFQAS